VLAAFEGARMSSPDTPRSSSHHSRTPGHTSQDEVVYRVDDHHDDRALEQRGLDVPATIGGALAALGTLVLLSSLVGAVVGTIGYQTGVDDQDLSIGGLVAGLVVLFLACVVGGWVAARMAGRRGVLHGVVAIAWLVLLAAALAALAAVAGSEYDVTGEIDLPSWFSEDALTLTAILTGIGALVLMLLGGALGGRLGDRHHRREPVSVVRTRREVRERSGGIATGTTRDGGRR
jgi:cation transport ATPase